MNQDFAQEETGLIQSLELRLQSKHRHMSSIYAVTQAINSQIETHALYDLYSQCMANYLGVEDLALYKFDDQWEKIVYRHTLIPDAHIKVSKALKYKKAARINSEDKDALGGYEYVIPVYHNDIGISFALLGEINCLNIESKLYLLQYAQVITNIVTMAIENKRLFQKEMEKKEFDKEMELASKIQGMIIPKRLPKNTLYEFAGLYLPHRSIGGDYYDVININKDEFIFCMGDISGKGIAAALVMANLQSYLNASPPKEMSNGRELVDRLNTKILSITNGEKFITLFVGKYNILTRELEYLNAGHNPPLLFNDGEVVKLDKGCALLGILEHIPKVQTGKILLKPDALILTYTDGLTEQENNNSELFGDDKLRALIMKNCHESAENFVKNLYSTLIDFKGMKNFGDDVSVLVGKFH